MNTTIKNAKKRFHQGRLSYQKLKEIVRREMPVSKVEEKPEEHIHNEHCNHNDNNEE